MITKAITKAMAARGVVAHIVKGVGTFGMPVSHCGRWLREGDTDARLCKSCVRISRYVAPVEIPTGMPVAANAEEFQTWDYTLTRAELDATIEKVRAINERCAKRGIPGGLVVNWEEIHRDETNFMGIRFEWTEYKTNISGIAPKLPDWEFIATLDYDHNAGLIVRTYPGVKSIDRSNLHEGWCDHCKTTRYRKNTYVMRNTNTGAQIQVGSSCIKDFTGWTALPVSFEKEMREISESFGGSERDYSVETILSIAWACIQTWGFVRSNDYENRPTVQRVRDVLNPPKQGRRPDYAYLAELERIKDHAAAAPEKAREIREWVLSPEFSGNSEYVLNLKNIAAAENVTSRYYGILASAPQAWARHQEKTLARKVADAPVSEWQGEIKSAITVTATIEAIRYIDGDFGVTTLYKMRDESGNLYEWFASNDKLGEDTGVTYTWTATVKAHAEWQGHKSTRVTRVRNITRVS